MTDAKDANADNRRPYMGGIPAEDELRKRALDAAHAGIDQLSEALTAGLLAAAVTGVRPVAEFVQTQGLSLHDLLAGLLDVVPPPPKGNDNAE
jgi:hypothetical protein|tara:strand:+ start:238 stop:516 length:279 start_codon:yes stop_codon:yes gene_type:complete